MTDYKCKQLKPYKGYDIDKETENGNIYYWLYEDRENGEVINIYRTLKDAHKWVDIFGDHEGRELKL